MEPDTVPVTIRQHEVLPPCCIVCGVEADRLERISQSGKSVTKKGALVTALGIAAGLVTGFYFLRSPRDQKTVELSVPVCERCSARGDVAPVGVDFARGEMTLPVHRRFAERLLELRRR
jgi:hypothetical protein